MKFEILDRKIENGSTCLLVKATLEEYISTMPIDYDSYDVQRSIVSNSYLDKLVDTVLKKGHIPSITLISEDTVSVIERGAIDDFKILDGLQRTYRLKVIYDTRRLFIDEIRDTCVDLSEFQIKRQYREQLVDIGSSGNLLMAIKSFYDVNGETKLNDCFSGNLQWFELWSGLTPEDEVRKMLVLNAGHKPVNIKHQLELIFRNVLPIIDEVKIKRITIVREKEVSSTKYSKDRTLGTYHFSHLISALVSFIEKKPITTNTSFIAKIQNDEKKLYEFMQHFTYEFLEQFLKAVYRIDLAAKEAFDELGIKWIGREVSLVSLFAAIGAAAIDNQEIESISAELSRNFDKCNLKEYEICRNSVDLGKVNIGNVNKRYIFEAFRKLIGSSFNDDIDWNYLFLRGNR